MVQILERPPSFGEAIARGLGGGISQGIGQGVNFTQQMALQQAKLKQDKKIQEQEKFIGGLDTIEQMRAVIARGNTGRGSGLKGIFGGEAAQDRQQLAQLGTSLIPLVAAGVPIRNQKEFEQYRKIITDPGSLNDEMLGALNGLEQIFKNKISGEPYKGRESSQEEEFVKVRNKKTGQVKRIPKGKLKEALNAGGEEV